VAVAHHEPHADQSAALERGEELPTVDLRLGERDAAPEQAAAAVDPPMATRTAQSITAPTRVRI